MTRGESGKFDEIKLIFLPRVAAEFRLCSCTLPALLSLTETITTENCDGILHTLFLNEASLASVILCLNMISVERKCISACL